MVKKKKIKKIYPKTHYLRPINELVLFERASKIIESCKQRAKDADFFTCRQTALMYWKIGKYLALTKTNYRGRRAGYGQHIFSNLSKKLVKKHGKSFMEENLYRMKQCARMFPDKKLITALTRRLTWSHFCELIRVKDTDARLYYANDAFDRYLSSRELRSEIIQKVYELEYEQQETESVMA